MRFITKAIGAPTNDIVIVGRENIPKGDNFGWWSMHYEYVEKSTMKTYRIEDLQMKYELGFMDSRLDEIISRDYLHDAIQVYRMSINHPRYDELVGSRYDIVFDEEKGYSDYCDKQ